MNENIYSNIVDKLVEDGYIVMEELFDKELCCELLDLATKNNNFKKAGISSSQNLHVDNSKRRDKIVWLDEDRAAQSKFLSFASSLQEYLNRSLYLGLNYYESHFAIYEKGDFYEKHLDAFRGSKNRVVTTVLYLNEEWKESDGGELLIYDTEDKLIMKTTPKIGTLVIFLSDKFPHEVLPTKKKRYSIAGWFRSDKR